MQATILLLALAGCGRVGGPLLLPCTTEQVEVARDAAGELGFSADELQVGVGSRWTLKVDWVGRHSQTPASDLFTVELGAFRSASESLHSPTNHGAARECAELDRLNASWEAEFSSADGQVVGLGTLSYSAASVDRDRIEIEGRTETLELDPARWLEVYDAVGEDLEPPERVSLFVGRYDHYDYASIGAEGSNYHVSVWKCDEQLKGECADWR